LAEILFTKDGSLIKVAYMMIYKRLQWLPMAMAKVTGVLVGRASPIAKFKFVMACKLASLYWILHLQVYQIC